MSVLQTLIDKRANTWELAKQHLDTLEAEGREFTGEADETWTRYNSDLADLDARISELSALEQRNREADEARERFGANVNQPEEEVTTDADRLRAMVSGEQRTAEFRDLTVGTASEGGNTVPTSFYGQLVEHLIENSAIRQTNVTVLTTDGGEDLQVPKSTAKSSAGIIGEGGSITESDPEFGQVTLGAYKYGFSIQISTELEQDTGIDLVAFLASQAGAALGNGSGAHFVAGTGSGQPNGVVGASTLGTTGATSVDGVFSADDLIDLYFSVIAPYRRQGTFMMSDAGMKVARKLKDADDQYLWVPGLVAGETSTLLGRPVVSDPNVPDPAVDAESVVFGDLSKYFIRDVRGVRAERSVDFAFQSDLVTWRFLLRTDGNLIDTTGAVKHFVGAAS